MLGTNFGAPTINGKSNVYNANLGDIVYDASDSSFYGRIHDSGTGTDVWAALTASASAVPVGTVITFTAETCPSGYVPADGRSVPQTGTYSSLYSILGATHGDGSTGAAGGGTCPDASGCFNVPDYRGQFLRGWANGSSADPDRSSRTGMNATATATGDHVGSVQPDQYASHSHNFRSTSAGATTATASNSSALALTAASNIYGNTVANFTLSSSSIGTSGGNETRPKNAYVNFCVKY